jgi:hypothetical protein
VAATVAPALLVRGRIERTGPVGRPGAADEAGPVGGAVNLVAGALRPLRVAVSPVGAVASRNFR